MRNDPPGGRLRRRIEDQSGFTLIEILVAMLLLTVGIFGAMTLVTKSFDTTAVAQRQDVGAQTARRVLDDARGLAYRDLASQPTALPSSEASNAGVTTQDGKAAGPSLDAQMGRVGTSGGFPAVRIGDLSGASARSGATRPNPVGGGVGPDGKPFDEFLVSPGALAASKYASGGNATRGIPRYQIVENPSGAGGVQRTHVFTTVSWRDESCPVLNLDNPLSQLRSTLENLGNLVKPGAPGSLYDLLIGSTGANGVLSRTVTANDRLLANLTVIKRAIDERGFSLGLNAVVVGLLGVLSNVALYPVMEVLGTVLTPVGKLVSELLKPLADLVDALLAPLTQLLSRASDLCDLALFDDTDGNGLLPQLTTLLKPLGDVNKSLAKLQGDLLGGNAVGGALTRLTQDLQAGIDASAGSAATAKVCLETKDPISWLVVCTVGGLLTTVVQALGNVTNGLVATLGNVGTLLNTTLRTLSSTATTLVTGAPGLLNALRPGSPLWKLITDYNGENLLRTVRNTKRVIVSVWPEMANGKLLGTRPQTYTTVISNPQAKALTAG